MYVEFFSSFVSVSFSLAVLILFIISFWTHNFFFYFIIIFSKVNENRLFISRGFC